jgi:hypothetical protein
MRLKRCARRIGRRGEAASGSAAFASSDDICIRRAPRPCRGEGRSLDRAGQLREGQSPVEIGGRRLSAPASDFGRKVLEGQSIGAVDDACDPPRFGDKQACARLNDRLDRARRARGDIALAFGGGRRKTRKESQVEDYSEKQNISIKCSFLQKLREAAKVVTTASTPGPPRHSPKGECVVPRLAKQVPSLIAPPLFPMRRAVGPPHSGRDSFSAKAIRLDTPARDRTCAFIMIVTPTSI